MNRFALARGPVALLAGGAVLLAAAALAVAVVALSSDSESSAKDASLRRGNALTGTTLRSPNGSYTVAVTDGGIVLTGPGGRIELDAGGVDVSGQLVRLNSSGCHPAARIGDRVPVSVPGVATTVQATIASGAPSVCIG
jgi:hypothetical protein